MDKNQAKISGIVVVPFEFHHKSNGKDFFCASVQVSRKNPSKFDYVNVVVPEDLVIMVAVNCHVTFTGEIKSFRKTYNGRNIRENYILADSFRVDENGTSDRNSIAIDGIIATKQEMIYNDDGLGVLRFTISIPGGINATTYVSCLGFGRIADYVDNLPYGTAVSVLGVIRTSPVGPKDSPVGMKTEINVKEVKRINEEN